MTHPTHLVVRDANGVNVRSFTVQPDGSDMAAQMLRAADLCYVLRESDGGVATIVPMYPPVVEREPAEPVYTVVLIDRAPEEASEGDFVAVVGVTQAELEGPGDWLGELAEAMAECTTRDALTLRDVVEQTSPEGSMPDAG